MKDNSSSCRWFIRNEKDKVTCSKCGLKVNGLWAKEIGQGVYETTCVVCGD